jgi:hypothetical protein
MKKMNRKMLVLVALLVLPLASLAKYAFYELSGAAPTLRDAIGKTVILPEETVAIARDAMRGNRAGTLRRAKYRWNDKLGFFDLEVEVSYSGYPGSRQLITGLSPFEAMGVKVNAPQQSRE